MEILFLLLLLFLFYAVFDPNIMAYRDMRHIKQTLGIKRKALKPLLQLALSQTDKAVICSANRVIKVVIVQISILLALLLLVFERCYINSRWLSGLGSCDKPSEYSHYLLFVWLGFVVFLLYTLWRMAKLKNKPSK